MSELVVTEESVDKVEAPQGLVLTAGGMLRNAREAAGLHVGALAVSMKIPVKKLEALESDRLDLLHDAVFVRALAASVCRALKIDSVPVLARLPSTVMPKLNGDERGINAPFRTPHGNAGQSISIVLGKPQVLIVLALLAGIVTVFFFPEKKANPIATEQSIQVPKGVVFSEALPAQKLSEESTQTPATPASSVAMITVQSDVAIAALPNGPGQAASSPSTPERNVLSASSPVGAPDTIVFKAKAEVWVKVVDASGVVQLSKTLAQGEVAGAAGSAPLNIVIGRVDAVDVEVRGKAFNLGAVAKENIARFEVK